MFTTAGRRMSKNLQQALDAFTGGQLRVTRDTLAGMARRELDGGQPWNDLFAAMAIELHLCEQRQDELFRRHELDRAAELDALPQPPLPVAEGQPMVHLDSGDWIDLDVYDTPPDDTPPAG